MFASLTRRLRINSTTTRTRSQQFMTRRIETHDTTDGQTGEQSRVTINGLRRQASDRLSGFITGRCSVQFIRRIRFELTTMLVDDDDDYELDSHAKRRDTNISEANVRHLHSNSHTHTHSASPTTCDRQLSSLITDTLGVD